MTAAAAHSERCHRAMLCRLGLPNGQFSGSSRALHADKQSDIRAPPRAGTSRKKTPGVTPAGARPVGFIERFGVAPACSLSVFGQFATVVRRNAVCYSRAPAHARARCKSIRRLACQNLRHAGWQWRPPKKRALRLLATLTSNSRQLRGEMPTRA